MKTHHSNVDIPRSFITNEKNYILSSHEGARMEGNRRRH